MEFGQDINMSNNKIVGLGQGTQAGDSVEFSQLYSVSSRIEYAITANSTFSIPNVLNVYTEASRITFPGNNPYIVNGKNRTLKYLMNLSASNSGPSTTINFQVQIGLSTLTLGSISIPGGVITNHSFLIEINQSFRNVNDQNYSIETKYFNNSILVNDLRKSVSIGSWDKTINNDIALLVRATTGGRTYNFQMQQLTSELK